jgi:ABC-2 type transport system ATP-binding protein
MSLQVEELSYRYGPRLALDQVGFAVAPGTFCALLGPNGAGKSTLFGLLTRLFTTPSGRIVVDGIDLARNPRAALARMGVVFQQPTLDLDLTLRRNLLYFAGLHGLSGRDAQTRADQALTRIGLTDRARDPVRALSGGQRRRLEIARALMHGPSVLLLDEPTVGLDAASRRDITAHVHALAAEQGMTILWATHLTDEVADTDRLVLLHRGRVLADTTAAGFRAERPLSDAFLAATLEDA